MEKVRYEKLLRWFSRAVSFVLPVTTLLSRTQKPVTSQILTRSHCSTKINRSITIGTCLPFEHPDIQFFIIIYFNELWEWLKYIFATQMQKRLIRNNVLLPSHEKNSNFYQPVWNCCDDYIVYKLHHSIYFSVIAM